MRVQELWESKTDDAIGTIASYLVLGGITAEQLVPVVKVLSKDKSLIYTGPMFRFIGNAKFNPTKVGVLSSWSMTEDGLEVALDNLSSTRGINGIIIKQVGTGLNIPAVIDKYSDQFEQWLDDDELDQLGDYYEEDEVLAMPNNPTQIATVHQGKIIPI